MLLGHQTSSPTPPPLPLFQISALRDDLVPLNAQKKRGGGEGEGKGEGKGEGAGVGEGEGDKSTYRD